MQPVHCAVETVFVDAAQSGAALAVIPHAVAPPLGAFQLLASELLVSELSASAFWAFPLLGLPRGGSRDAVPSGMASAR